MIDGGVEAVPVVQQAAQAAVQAASAAPSDGVPFVPWLPLLFGLAVFFLVELVRALPFAKETREKKPLSCDLCMTFWISAAMTVTLVYVTRFLLLNLLYMLPAAGLALLLLALKSYWKPSPP